TDPEHGTVVLNQDGSFTYTPKEGYCGEDEFTYILKDVDGDYDTATVTINIECINHIPVANDDTFNTIEDTPITDSVAGNDIPSKDGGNVWLKETDPEHGTVVLNQDGSFTYTPEEGYCGEDEFTYILKDVDGDYDTATVTINIECVNDIPVANDDSARICQDSTLCSSVADNDIPSKDGENTWSLLSNPAHGTAVVDSDGTYCYTPIEGWSGMDCFTYQLCDIDNDCSQGTVTITVVEKCNCDLISFAQDGCMYPDELEDLIKDVNIFVCAECDDTPEWSFPEWPVDQTTGFVMSGEYTFSVTCHAGGEELEDCDSTCEGVILCTCQHAVCPCEAYAEDIIVGCGVSKEDLSALVVADCQDKGDYVCDQTPVIDLSGVITDPSTGFVTGGSYTVDCSPSWVECPTAKGDVIVECNDIAHAPDICLPIVCVERSGKLSCRDYSLPLYSAGLKQMVTAAGGGCADELSEMSVVLPGNINWGVPGLYQYKVVCKDAKGLIIASDTGRLILDDNCGCGPCGCSGFC
ncbi:Ig-like domain-containing protein, partial [Methanothrix sp.]|uniref:Ig-like domain-containing protein n=1 Tax=Methanothrix sp. TaxID=90426 RepID=UPI003C788848